MNLGESSIPLAYLACATTRKARAARATSDFPMTFALAHAVDLPPRRRLPGDGRAKAP